METKDKFKKHQDKLDDYLIVASKRSGNYDLAKNVLQNKILPKVWNSGELFFKEFAHSINTSSDSIKELIVHTYDKYLLYVNLNQNLTSCQNKTKCVKI